MIHDPDANDPDAKNPEVEDYIGVPKLAGELAPKNDTRDNKPKLSLIPVDILNEFMPPAYEEGIIKYERESWRRGFYITKMIDSANRHLDDFSHKGEDYDPGAAESGIIKHHLAGVIFSCISALHTLKYHPELDDRYDPATGIKLINIRQKKKEEPGVKHKSNIKPLKNGVSSEATSPKVESNPQSHLYCRCAGAGSNA